MTIHLGMVVLFRRFPNDTETWDLLVELFQNATADSIPPALIYFLGELIAHIKEFGVFNPYA